MDSPGSQGAPRFSSFQPPATADPAPRSPPSWDHDTRRHRSRHHQRADRNGSPRARRHKRRRRDSRDREAAAEEIETSMKGEENSDVKLESEEEIVKYVVDIQGDRGVTRYGVDKYDVPAYHRTGGGFIIGLPDHRIDYESRHDDTLLVRRTDEVAAAKPKPLSAPTTAIRFKDLPVRIQPENTSGVPPGMEHQPNFISTSPPPQSGLAPNDDGAPSFSSIRTLSNAEEEATTEGSYGDKIYPALAEVEIMRRNVELNRAVEQNPKDIKAWIRLAEHQELAALGPRPEDRRLTYAETQRVAWDKLHVYERAIKANRENPERDYLVLGRMEEGAVVWDTVQLTREWEEVLCYHSEFISVWIEYLDYCQTDPRDFEFDSCFKSYLYCLKIHSHVGFGPQRAQIRSYLLLRLTLFLRESGHMELAVGLWQAVLEFVIFRPAFFSENKEQALEEFRQIWTPEYIKIGERNWRPWNREEDARASADKHVYMSEVDLPNLFGSWAVAERERMIKNSMPSHTFDESDEDEAFRVVLSGDCTKILPYFWGLDDSLGSLVDGFIQFCHLPHLTFPANMQTSRLWTGDSFLRNEFMDDPRNTIAGWIRFHATAPTTTVEPFAFPHHTFINTTDTLFADPKSWFSALDKWAATTSHKSCVISPNFVVSTLFALVEVFEDSHLAEYAIAVSFACDPILGKKYGKRLLRERSSNLRLYNAFALMHWRTDDRDTAIKVWSTALSKSQNFDDCELADSALMWNSWVWEMLHAGEKERAAYLLQAMPFKRVQTLSYDTADEFEFNNVSILRLKQFLSAAQKSALEFRKLQAYTAYTDCAAIIRYLMCEPLHKALEEYDAAVLALKVVPNQQNDYKVFGGELLHQARARLMYHYVDSQSGQFRPADVREILLDSLEWWPHNTMFLSLFKWNDGRLQLTHRSRDIFDVTIGTQGRATKNPNMPAPIHRVPVTTHLFNIYCEMGLTTFSGATVHTIRAVFERAVVDATITTRKTTFELASSTSARNNLTIWKLYILFELYAENNVARAREIYFRALSSCPWSKELYMLAFEHLRADLTARLPICRSSGPGEPIPAGFDTPELRAVYSEMLRRGLRVHYHVEGLWPHKAEEGEVS